MTHLETFRLDQDRLMTSKLTMILLTNSKALRYKLPAHGGSKFKPGAFLF